MRNTVNRRAFMGAAGSTLGLGITGCAAGSNTEGAFKQPYGSVSSSVMIADLHQLVNQTPLMDTHEHLPPEADRLANVHQKDALPAPDFGMLMSHYTDSDLQVAGMSKDDYRKLLSHELSPGEKWKLVSPYYERCRHTGYQICVRESIRALYGEEDIREDNCETISQRLREDIQPGFYRRLLRDVAHIEHAQINCLKSGVFRDSEPSDDLLSFDLSTVGIASGVNKGALNRCAGTEVVSLKQAHEVIDHAFEKFGPRAIAVKDQCAYGRRLDFEDVSDEKAAPLFERFAREESLTAEEIKALQDNLFRRCVRCAVELHLPIKLHTGYAAGCNSMHLARVRDNLTDLTRLIRDFPEATFVLMHIAYPYQHELIALCKQYSNVYADMCWAWIIDPASATRFLKDFIMAVPACKLFPFGGDFMPVELTVGHARVARHGIVLGIAQLLEDGWLTESDVPALVERIMRGNARETYDLERVLQAQSS